MEIQASFDLTCDEDWQLLCKIRQEMIRKGKNQKTQRVEKVEELSSAEEAVLQAVPESYETPTLDIMRKAGLGKMNLSALVRRIVDEDPGLTKEDLVDRIQCEYPDRWEDFQINGAMYAQVAKENIVRSRGRLYSPGV